MDDFWNKSETLPSTLDNFFDEEVSFISIKVSIVQILES